MIIRAIFVSIIVVMAMVPSFFYLGPTIEAKLLPVMTIEAVDIRYGKVSYQGDERQVVFFKTHVEKYRPCALEIFSFRWLLDHSVAVTPVFVAEDNLPFQPNSVITVGQFTSRELWTFIPAASYNYPITIFRGTAYFRCHALWPLAFYFEVPLEIPDLTDLRSQMKSERIRTRIADRRRMNGE